MPNRKYDVLIIANSTSGGGAESTMLRLHSKFTENGITSIFLALNESGVPVSNHQDIIELNRPWKSNILVTIAKFNEFKKLLKNITSDCVLVNCELPELFVALTQKLNSRIIFVEHTSRPWHGRRILGCVIRFILNFRKSDWITVNSNQKNIWGTFRRATYIPNAIRLKDLNFDKSSKLQIKGLVYLGRLRGEKRPGWIIQAAKMAGLELHLIGEGEIHEKLMNEYCEEKKIHFHGYVHNPWSHIPYDCLVVVPSKFEGDGLVVAEAIARGNPILLADNPDLRRFQLPEINYFKSLEALTDKLIANASQNFKIMVPPEKSKQFLIESRTEEFLFKKWKYALNINGGSINEKI
jgi:glycosyltransferase involved in cell wall biosynthesis